MELNMISPSLKSDFIQIISASQGIPKKKLNFDQLFEDWAKSKEYFFKMFGNKLICQSPEKITFHLDEKTRLNRVDEFLDWLSYSFIWSDTKNADLAALSEFVYDNKDDFFNNSLTESYKIKIYLNGYHLSPSYVEIPKGIKVIKAFKYFIKDKNLLYNIQNKASMIIQEDKIEGYLCMSIHPLDYLTISENNLGWRSCHSLDGDYRAGNLSYMADSSTVVCYLASENKCNLYGVDWNNKKWRVLLFFSEQKNYVFAGRQYPFQAMSALDKINSIFFKSDKNTSWSKWEEGIAAIEDFPNGTHTEFTFPYYNLGHNIGLVALNDLVIQYSNDLFFNDLIRSNSYKNPYYSVKINDSNQIISNSLSNKIRIGKEIHCPICHKRYLTNTNSMVCLHCEKKINFIEEDTIICECCETPVRTENAITVGDLGNYVCPECAKRYTKICGKCGHRYYNNEFFWDQESGKFICEWCKKDLEEEKVESCLKLKTHREPLFI